MTYAGVEQEAVLLKAVWDMIDDMVNLEVFQYPVTSRPTNLVFKSGSHKRIFAILLADFLAQPRRAALPFAFAPSGQAARETDRTYLFYLEAICRQPQLGAEASGLAAAASSFADWLNAECHCPAVWLPELDLSLDLRVSRVWLLKVVGDANKHNFSRLDARVRQIKAMLARHGHVVDEGMSIAPCPTSRTGSTRTCSPITPALSVNSWTRSDGRCSTISHRNMRGPGEAATGSTGTIVSTSRARSAITWRSACTGS